MATSLIAYSHRLDNKGGSGLIFHYLPQEKRHNPGHAGNILPDDKEVDHARKTRRARKPYRPKSIRLPGQVREVLRYHHYSYKTEQAYVGWILRFIRFNGTRHPATCAKPEIERSLIHLAINRAVSASTRNQAMNAILFLYRQVLGTPAADDLASVRSRKPRRLPTVLSSAEMRAVPARMKGAHRLVAETMYAGGLRPGEALRLRVHDLDFDNHQLCIRDSKGNRDGTTLFPSMLHRTYRAHLSRVRSLHRRDLAEGFGEVAQPDALARKLPGGARSWGWQYVFPSGKISTDPRSGVTRRHHMHESPPQRAVSFASKQAGISKRVTSHVLRHSSATHMLEAVSTIRLVQKPLGHKDVSTTEIYTHVIDKDLRRIDSPIERLKNEEGEASGKGVAARD
jgi:integron integrase